MRAERRAGHRDDQFLKATGEPAHERLIGRAHESVAGTELTRAVRGSKPRLTAQRQVNGDRVGRAAVNHLGGPLDSVGRAAYPGQPDLRELDVNLGGVERGV